jgi:hypothetical protein
MLILILFSLILETSLGVLRFFYIRFWKRLIKKIIQFVSRVMLYYIKKIIVIFMFYILLLLLHHAPKSYIY